MVTVNRITFCRQLKESYVPHWAYPRIEPVEVFDYYKLGTISTKRRIDSSNKEYEKVLVDQKAQRQIWDKLTDPETPLDSYVIGISSCVNDYLAHEFAALLHLEMLRTHNNPPWTWVTSGFDSSKASIENTPPKIVVIRSVLPERDRLYRIRDILDFFKNSMRILIIGGINAIDYFDQFLRHPLNGAFHVEGYKRELPSAITIKTSNEFSECKFPAFILGDDAKEVISSIRRK